MTSWRNMIGNSLKEKKQSKTFQLRIVNVAKAQVRFYWVNPLPEGER